MADITLTAQQKEIVAGLFTKAEAEVSKIADSTQKQAGLDAIKSIRGILSDDKITADELPALQAAAKKIPGAESLNGWIDNPADATEQQKLKDAKLNPADPMQGFMMMIFSFIAQALGLDPEAFSLGQATTPTAAPAPTAAPTASTIPAASATPSSAPTTDIKLTPAEQQNANIYQQALARLPKPIVSPGDYSKEFLSDFSASEELKNYNKDKQQLKLLETLRDGNDKAWLYGTPPEGLMLAFSEAVRTEYKSKLLIEANKTDPIDPVENIFPEGKAAKFKDSALAVGKQNALQFVHQSLSQGGIPTPPVGLEKQITSNDSKIRGVEETIDRAKTARKTTLENIADLEAKIELNQRVVGDGTKGRSTYGAMYMQFSNKESTKQSLLEEQAAEKIVEQKKLLTKAKKTLKTQEETIGTSAKELMQFLEKKGELDTMQEWEKGKGSIAELLNKFNSIKSEIEAKKAIEDAKKEEAKRVAKEAADKAKAEAEKAKAVAAEKTTKEKEEADLRKALEGTARERAKEEADLRKALDGDEPRTDNYERHYHSSKDSSQNRLTPEYLQSLGIKQHDGQDRYMLPSMTGSQYVNMEVLIRLDAMSGEKISFKEIIANRDLVRAVNNKYLEEQKLISTQNFLDHAYNQGPITAPRDIPQAGPASVSPSATINSDIEKLQNAEINRLNAYAKATAARAQENRDIAIGETLDKQYYNRQRIEGFDSRISTEMQNMHGSALLRDLSQLNHNLNTIATTSDSLSQLMVSIESAAKKSDVDKSEELLTQIGQLTKQAHAKGLTGFEKELRDLGSALLGAATNNDKNGQNRLTGAEVGDLKNKIEAAKDALETDEGVIKAKIEDIQKEAKSLAPQQPKAPTTPNKKDPSDSLRLC